MTARVVRCGACGVLGHNRRSCRADGPPPPLARSASPNPPAFLGLPRRALDGFDARVASRTALSLPNVRSAPMAPDRRFQTVDTLQAACCAVVGRIVESEIRHEARSGGFAAYAAAMRRRATRLDTDPATAGTVEATNQAALLRGLADHVDWKGRPADGY